MAPSFLLFVEENISFQKRDETSKKDRCEIFISVVYNVWKLNSNIAFCIVNDLSVYSLVLAFTYGYFLVLCAPITTPPTQENEAKSRSISKKVRRRKSK